MTFYLSNNDVQPVGWEPLEFIDLPTMAEAKEPSSATNSVEEPSDGNDPS